MEDTEKQKEKKSISEREEGILAYWDTHKIFQKTLEKNEGKDPYVFYDGPPFATGLPHHGHLLQGAIKDTIPRYQTMRGRFVRRQWGWDCHGLPVENLVEKELGLNQKSDIEKYGIENFNAKARESVLTYDKEWKHIIPRMGRFVDMEHAYKTMDSGYTESIWWAFATLYKKKLVYEGYKAMHICPRCETTLAASEVAQGYKDIKDISVYVKFALVDEPGTFFVAWTTTPWTLPGNVALAVGPNIEYIKVTLGTENYILAKARLESVLKILAIGEPSEVVAVSSKEIIGKSYVPVFDTYAKDESLENHGNGWKVYPADFVTTESGTGIVHIAPAFGEDDMALGKKEKLPFVQHVSMDGKIKEEVVGFGGMSVKPKSDNDKERLATDIAILKYLQENKTFFVKENFTHSYPHCWRCDWPLINYAASSWFVNVTTLKPRLIEENKEINWIPENTRTGRFGKWLEGARDWAISRSRYWGAPIPVWKCNKCANVEVVGSLEELRTKIDSTNTYQIMRHGEADSNVQNIVSYKAEDEVHLTEKGRTQVRATAEKLKGQGIEIIIASPVLRTKETATIVAEAIGLPVEDIIFEPRIAEVNTGEFNGKSIETYRSYFADTLEKFTKPSPGGETLEQMKMRIAEFLYDIDQKYHGKNILIVTHEYGSWMMEAVARGATNEEASRMRNEAGDDYIDYAEAREFSFVNIPHNARYELDFHRPFIDRVTFHCTCELGTMSRIPDVFDCWFESGSMPFAQFHYMGDERSPAGKLFMKNFPADFIAEAVDQTRGWFYTMLILSVGLFDRAAYKSVITTGLILAEDGQKMSKKLKNFPDPMEVTAQYGADALRFYMLNSPVVRGEDLRFSVLGVDEIFKKVTMRLDNVYAFYELYAEHNIISQNLGERGDMLDKWIVARWQETHAEVTHHLDTHELDKATRLIMPLLEDLSTWYLRRSRDRFKSTDMHTRDGAIETTGWILLQISKLLAPFMPFLAEDLYQRLNIEEKKESVHLESWPAMGISPHTILEEMEEVRKIVSIVLEERARAGIKVRQPLGNLTVFTDKLSVKNALISIIADEVNVKEIQIAKSTGAGTAVELDITITPELKEEGELRDFIRAIQDMRKKAELHPSDRIILTVPTEKMVLLEKYHDELIATVGASQFLEGTALTIKKV